MQPAQLSGFHHVAYRCRDAAETVAFYSEMLGMGFQLAIAENEVPSTGEPDPYMHIFLDAGNNNVLAFFELPGQPDMDRDQNTPAWVQHIALRVDSLEQLTATQQFLESKGVDVLGPVNHGIFHSIYFHDPSGHRLELATDVGTADEYRQLKQVAPEMLKEWSRTRRAPRHAAWLHQSSDEDA
ncbi:MAG: VOC family protein [Pseudomonadota bacterium]